jgi:HK97 family phage major capsid protein
MNYELEKLGKEIKDGIEEVKDRHESRLKKIETRLDKEEVMMREKNRVFTSTSEAGYHASTPEEKTFSEFLKHGEQRMDEYERKTLRLANETGAGYLAPDAYTDEVIMKLQEYSPVRSVARIMQTDATAIQIPKQTGAVDANWTSEIATRTEDANLTFGFVKLSRQLIEDSRVNVDAFLSDEFGRKFANVEGLSFISGNTTGRPEGLLTNANIASSNSGDGSNLTPDGFMDLVYSLPAEYRKNASFLMNRSTIQEARKLKNNQNDYIWQPGLAAGQPERLLGYPVFEACDMPDVANAAYPVLFGDFKRGYFIVDRVSMDVQRLVERYAEYGIIAYMARKRVGGQVVLAEAIRKMLIAT